MSERIPAVWHLSDPDEYVRFLNSLADSAGIVASSIIESITRLDDGVKNDEMLSIAIRYIELEARKTTLNLSESMEYSELYLVIYERDWFIPIDEVRRQHQEFLERNTV